MLHRECDEKSALEGEALIAAGERREAPLAGHVALFGKRASGSHF